jgi:hypothetical protein
MSIENTLYHPETNSLECLHCFDTIELRRVTGADPELLMAVREEYELDHSKCHLHKDIRKANQAREYRTEGQRRRLHEARANALRVLGC